MFESINFLAGWGDQPFCFNAFLPLFCLLQLLVNTFLRRGLFINMIIAKFCTPFQLPFLNSANHSSYQSMINDWREGFDKRTNSSLPPPGMFSTMVTTLPGTNCTCVGGAAGEVGGDTLLLGFFTAGESTISKALPARRWWNEYQGPWQGLYTKQVQSHRKGELPPRVSNSCLVAASTSAICSSLAWTRQNENCMS